MDLNDVCYDILKLSPKIRFVGVYYHNELTSKSRSLLDSMITEEQSKGSIQGTVIRWNSRKMLRQTLGMPHYALALYDKVFRVTFALQDDDLIFVSIDTDCDIMGIIESIQKLQKKIIQKLYL